MGREGVTTEGDSEVPLGKTTRHVPRFRLGACPRIEAVARES